jgi:hypothetical protein
LGFGGPGLKIHAPKENSYPAPVLEGEGRVYNVRRGSPTKKSIKRTQKFVGLEKWISGFFRASGNQKSYFLHPRKVPPPGRAPYPLILRPERPLITEIFKWTPGVFYTYFYNHVHRLRLEKTIIYRDFISSNGYYKTLLDPGGGFNYQF